MELISTAEVARRKGVDQSSVRRAIRDGRLRGQRYGRDYMVGVEDVESWKPRRYKKNKEE